MINGHATPVPGWDGGDGNNAYLDKTLRHEPVELALDDRVSGSTILQLWGRAAGVSMILWLLVGIPMIIIGFGSLAADSGPSRRPSGYGYGYQSSGPDLSGVGTVIGLLLLLSAACFVIFWVVLLASRLTEPIGEWRVLLHDRTENADSAYFRIRSVVRQRDFPIYAEDRRMAAGPGDREINWRLVLRSGDCSANVSVFRYGSCLYLGWQMWRTRRGGRLILQFLTDILASITGNSGIEWAMLRTERTRAMREAVHAACREGLIVAIEQTEVPLEEGFPGGILPPLTSQALQPQWSAGSNVSAPYPAAPAGPIRTVGVPPQPAGSPAYDVPPPPASPPGSAPTPGQGK